MGGNIDIEQLDEWDDVFNNQVSNRTNVLDIAAHYPYSPERWRIFVDGTRVFPEYGAVSQYTHATDHHKLQPAAGETVVFRTAERPRYVVQFELAATFAFKVNQSLQTGDSIQVGLYDGTDGWYMEHDGSHADDRADFVLERGGSEVYRREDINIFKDVLTNARLKLLTGWYDITRQKWERSYSEDGNQQNPLIIKTSNDGQRGPQVGNLPLWFSVTASGTTTDLELQAGSCAQVNLGSTTQLTRTKIAEVDETPVDTTDAWTPIYAVRVDPDRQITNVQLRDLNVREYTASADVRILAQAHDASKVLDGNGDQLTDANFSAPNEQTPTNSVIQETFDVEQAADSTGTPVTSTADPGGYQVGLATLYVSGKGGGTRLESASLDEKRAIHNSDVVVFWARTPSTGDVTFDYSTEQDW